MMRFAYPSGRLKAFNAQALLSRLRENDENGILDCGIPQGTFSCFAIHLVRENDKKTESVR
jgi:hypothetical protein